MTITIKFKSKTKRDDFYRRRKRTPNSVDVTKNIYINEELMLHRARLYHDTRKLVKRGKLSYTWTQHGNIMIRVTEDSQPIAVFSNEELQPMLSEAEADNFEPAMASEETVISSDED